MKQILLSTLAIMVLSASAFGFAAMQPVSSSQKQISVTVVLKNQVLPLKGFASTDQCAGNTCYDI